MSIDFKLLKMRAILAVSVLCPGQMDQMLMLVEKMPGYSPRDLCIVTRQTIAWLATALTKYLCFHLEELEPFSIYGMYVDSLASLKRISM